MDNEQAYNELTEEYPELEFSITEGINSGHHATTIYVTREWNDLENTIAEAHSYADTGRIEYCLESIRKQLIEKLGAV